ncbi:MAG: hypothetical protein HY271_19705 [Deltaproteobacteria bacterium]|nr:hypothetical protein [Deltaproteobacteria bacterium]
MPAIKLWKRVGVVLVVASAVGTAGPSAVGAHGRSRDPFVQAETQRKRNEEHRAKRREQNDVQGAEARDAKKSAADSRQNQMQTELGTPNQQNDRWNMF